MASVGNPFHSTRSWIVVSLAMLLVGCTTAQQKGGTTAPRNSGYNNLPMFGQPGIQRPEHLKEADRWLIAYATAKGGSSEEASDAFISEALRYLQEKNYDLAMHRFNQAWLLNAENYYAYAGFGKVLFAQGKFGESAEHFQRAIDLSKDQPQRHAIVAELGTVYSFWAASPSQSEGMRARLFEFANERFRESTAEDSSYGEAWCQWASSLYREGNYAQSWAKVREAREQSKPAFTPKFLRELAEKMPEPK
jgi:tetratricopeptide (TPR) repeat protein